MHAALRKVRLSSLPGLYSFDKYTSMPTPTVNQPVDDASMATIASYFHSVGSSSPWATSSYLAAAAVFWVAGVLLYRRYFHPLAQVPGPALAAVTHLYAFYFSNVGGSRYYAQIERLHRKYGAVFSPLIIFNTVVISRVDV